MDQETNRKLQVIHNIIDRAAQANIRGSITINFGGENRIIPEYKLGLTDSEVEIMLASRIEQNNLRKKQTGKQDEFRGK